PFEQVVQACGQQQNIQRNPLFDLLLSYQASNGEKTQNDAEILSNRDAKCEFSVFVTETLSGIDCIFEYETAKFNDAFITAFAGYFEAVLCQFEQAEQRLSDVQLLSLESQLQLVEQTNGELIPEPKPILWHFNQQVNNAPSAIAIQLHGSSVSYAALNDRAKQLAVQLQHADVIEGDRVSVALAKQTDLVATLLAVLMVGATYVPLDLNYPAAHQARILKQAKTKLMVDQAWVDAVSHESSAEVTPAHSNQPAYIMFTSGSTGEPKGVVIPQAGVVRLACEQPTFAITAKDRLLLNAPVAFDASTFEVWGALLNGACLVIMPDEKPSLSDLATVIIEQNVSLLWLTAPLFNDMISYEITAFEQLRLVVAGGDVLSPQHIQRLQQEYADLMLINGYGPTENTTFTCLYTIPRLTDDAAIPIGKPVCGSTVYLLDGYQQVVPKGAVGELYTGGVGVAAGYWQNDALTQQAFLADPFSQRQDAMMYRTGDMARLLPSGDIAFLGRRDSQVKRRGNRVELADIEQRLHHCKGVLEAVVVLHPNLILSAYVVVESLALPEVRQFCQTDLPRYMQPDDIQILTELVKTPSGKIDRKALPKPVETISHKMQTEPVSATQKILCQLWSEVLNQTVQDIDADFFELGGHSLSAMRLFARLKETLDWSLPLAVVWEAPTPRLLEAHVEQLGEKSGAGSAWPALIAVEARALYPLSHAQERIWFLHQLEPDNAVFNIPYVVSVKGELSIECLSNAIDCLVQRHESLRMQFVVQADRPYQAVLDAQQHCLQQKTIEEPERLDCIEQESARPLRIDDGEVFRAVLWQSPEQNTLQLSLHHIICDGWSLGLLTHELMTVYQQFVIGAQVDVKVPSLQYHDYVMWQREWLTEAVLEVQLDYWVQKLSGCPALLTIPTDYPRPAIQRFVGDHYVFNVEPELASQLTAFANTQGVTLYMLTMAIWQSLLCRYSGQTDICVGSPVVGRPLTALESMVGMFVNAGVIRGDFALNPTFTALLKQIKQTVLEAFAHQDLPAEKVIEAVVDSRSLQYAPIAQFALAFQQVPALQPQTSDLEFESIGFNQGTSKYDMTLAFVASDGYLQGEIEYNTDLFNRDTVEQVARDFVQLAQMVIQDDLPLNSYMFRSISDLKHELSLDDSIETIVPLTTIQRDLYIDSLLKADTRHQCLGGHIDIHQSLNIDVWQSASQQLVVDYAPYRSQLIVGGLHSIEPAYLCVHANLAVKWEVIEWPDDDDSLVEIIHETVYEPYDLTCEMPFRALLVKLSETHYRAVIASHHLISDGVSGALFLSKLGEYYQCALSGEPWPEMQGDPFAYSQYHRQHFDVSDTHLFWQEQLAQVKPLSLPAPFTQAVMETQVETFTASEWKAIRRFSRAQSISPAILFKALFSYALAHWQRPEHDFMFFDIVDNRTADWRETVGCFFQQVPIVIPLDYMSASADVADFLSYLRHYYKEVGHCKDISIRAQQHICDPGAVKVYFNYYHFPAKVTFLGQKERIEQYPPQVEPEQLYCVVNAGKQIPELRLYGDTSILNGYPLLLHMTDLLKQLMAGVNRFSQFNVWLEHEQNIVSTMNHTEYQYELSGMVPECILRQIQHHKHSVALIENGEKITYQMLEAQACQVARRLQLQGVQANDVILLHMQRSAYRVSVLYGILKSGAAFCPVEVDWPEARVDFILQDSGAVVIISDESDRSWPEHIPVLVASKAFEKFSKNPVEALINGHDLAYVLYTSGSTGQPKGVMIEHHSLRNRLLWMQQAYPLQNTDRVLQKTPYTFDVSVWEFFWPLMVGAGLVVTKPEGHKDPDYLVSLIQEAQVTTVHFVPSMLSLFLQSTDVSYCQTLKQIFVSGEALSRSVQNSCLETLPCALTNLYGPTEAAIDVSYWNCELQSQGDVP
ncbi:MAG: amino acid adenylation domain-containing protein, partial [Methylococcales bacterium]|nr:amino acid adenylation domain-containing protein [Methylococcales bacterium]